MDLLDHIRASARDLAARAPGTRADWNEAEVTVAALALFYADPSRLGGTRAGRRQHPAVVAAARAVGRTEDAVVLKVMNLRSALTAGGRGMAHGAKLDRWAIETFAPRLDLLVLAVAVVAEVVPGVRQVLDLLVEPDSYGEHQEGSAVAAMPAEEYATTAAPITSVLQQVLVRRGQKLFRSRVMANYAHACGFCGLRALRPETDASLLVASHIRPWREASPHERLDPRNGLSLCVLHDRAFDGGLMTLDEDLRVVVSVRTRELYGDETKVKAITDLHGAQLRREADRFEAPAPDYLAFHRDNVFEAMGGIDVAGR